MAILAIFLDPPRKDVKVAQLARFAVRVRRLVGVRGRVDILITSSRRLQELNLIFRKRDKPTDVLSFPRGDGTGGDIAISAEIAAENAARFGHTTSDELKILMLHAMLHLAGYDHERDNGEMASRETALRRKLKLPGALTERSEPFNRARRRRREGPKAKRPEPKGRQAEARSFL